MANDNDDQFNAYLAFEDWLYGFVCRPGALVDCAMVDTPHEVFVYGLSPRINMVDIFAFPTLKASANFNMFD